MVTTDKKTATPESQLRAFIARLDTGQQKLVRSVRATLRKRFATANELAYDYSSFVVIGYSPTDRGIDAPISLAARADRVELYFNNGPRLPDPKKLLSGSGKQTRFVRLESAQQLSDPDIEGFIDAALALATTPMPAKGKGTLQIKTNKLGVTKRKSSRRARAK